MQTHFLSPHQIQDAAKLLLKGLLVAFPTETVYGLGASIFNIEAIRSIFLAKGRPSDNPLICHVSSIEQVATLTQSFPPSFHTLSQAFWPGPLTLVLPKRAEVPFIVSGGKETVAIRFPAHPVARALIEAVGVPLAAPSANLSGKPSSTRVEHVLKDFEGKIAAVIDGGPCSIGLESTVISLCQQIPCLLRHGSISKEEIENTLGYQILEKTSVKKGESPLSPGQQYRHYAPNATVLLFDSWKALETHQNSFPERSCFIIQPTPHQLYAQLRSADEQGYAEVLVYCDSSVISNAALFNRLQRASEKKE